MPKSLHAFDDPAVADTYADRAARFVPVYREIHRMAAVLMDEHAPQDARVLVLGAGGGLETKAFAQTHTGWTFDAVDAAAAMLDLAVRTLGPDASRVRMHKGYIDDAPAGPFDAATSLLTLHFIEHDERRRTAAEVRRRLAPGAPFVVMHLSFPQRDDAEKARTSIAADVPVLTPEQDRAILQDAGFTDVTEFFSAFTFRGWVGYA
jgi:tRNA (cmo5U34)-methyltransferase